MAAPSSSIVIFPELVTVQSAVAPGRPAVIECVGELADPFGNLGFNRSFYSQMIFRSFDGTGRIVLPGNLAERFAEREVLIAGSGRYLELWNPGDFDAAVSALDFE